MANSCTGCDCSTLKPIGVLGGTFDPIHLAHKALGEAAMEEIGLSKLIVMPAKMQPFKQDKKVAEDFHRLNMAKLTFEGVYNVEVCDYEIENTVISYTFDTLKYLKEQYPEYEIYFISGTDSFLHMEKWYKGTDLLKNFSFAVCGRPGYKEEELEVAMKKYGEVYGAKVFKLKAQMPAISSTIIREKLSKGESVSELVSKEVERYILKNGLYR